MLSITPVMSAMRREEWVIWSIVVTTSATTRLPSTAVREADDEITPASLAASALCATVSLIWLMAAAVCCRLDAVCSVRLDRSWLPAAISAAAISMLCAESCTMPTMRRRLVVISAMEPMSWPISSWPLRTRISWLMSPWAMARATLMALFRPLTMERVMLRVSTTVSNKAKPTITASSWTYSARSAFRSSM